MKRKYKNINSILGKILNQYNLNHLYALESIKKNWLSFDKTIAAHARPINYDDKSKVLTLKVDNISWKKEFINNIDILKIKIQNAYKNVDIKYLEII